MYGFRRRVSRASLSKSKARIPWYSSLAVVLNFTDWQELGIDILSEDNRTTVHHRVAAKVYCVFNSDDAALSSR